jgi:hypothetical protein
MAQTDEVFGGVGRGQGTKDYQDWLEEMRKETNALPMPDLGVPLAQKTGGNYSAPFALPQGWSPASVPGAGGNWGLPTLPQGGYVPSAAPIFKPGQPGTFAAPSNLYSQFPPLTDADYYATQVMPGGKSNQFAPSTQPPAKEPITSKNFGFAPAHDPVTGAPIHLPDTELQKLLVKGVLASGVASAQAGDAAKKMLDYLTAKNANKLYVTPLDDLADPKKFQQMFWEANNSNFSADPWKGDTMADLRNQIDPFTGQWIPKAGGGGTTPNITYRPRALGFTAGDGTPVYDRGGGFMPPGSNPLQPPTTDGQSKKWTPQAWQSDKGLIRWDERDWSTVSDMARPFIDAYLRGQGWTPTGQYGWYGPTEYKYSGLKTPNNIFFDPATLRTVPEAIANELRGLFAAKGWMPAITPIRQWFR